MQDSPDDRAGDVPRRAPSGDAIDGGSERDVADVERRIARMRRILEQRAFLLDSPPGDRWP